MAISCTDRGVAIGVRLRPHVLVVRVRFATAGRCVLFGVAAGEFVVFIRLGAQCLSLTLHKLTEFACLSFRIGAYGLRVTVGLGEERLGLIAHRRGLRLGCGALVGGLGLR